MNFLSRLFVSALCGVFFVSTVSAHEFWIEPEKFQVETGDALRVHLRNGQKFKGVSLSFFETRFTRFEVASGDQLAPVMGRMGDSPAMQGTADADGLMVIVHETTPSRLTYKEWGKFAAFAAHKDFKDIEARHQAKGFPREGFGESYTRHAKSLIDVGSGAGSDRAFGMEIEFVALTNPYQPDFDGIMRVQLLFAGQPRPDTQVEVFQRVSETGDVNITLARTDAQGIAAIPVSPGDDYLFDAVVLQPYTGDQKAVWQTLWAALTFGVPK